MDINEFASKIDINVVLPAMTQHFKQTMALFNMVNYDEFNVITNQNIGGVVTYTVICKNNIDASEIYTKISTRPFVVIYDKMFTCNYQLQHDCIHISIF